MRHSMFLCLLLMGLIMMNPGCTKEEPKEVSEKKAAPAKVAEKAPEAEKPAAQIPPEDVKKTSGEERAKVEGTTEMPSAEIVILSPLWEGHTRPGVVFTHEKHLEDYDIACDECHHVYENGKNVWEEGMPVAKCEACHNEKTVRGESKLSPELKKKNLKLAFHRNCQKCHRKLKREDSQSKAPTVCTKCHTKKD